MNPPVGEAFWGSIAVGPVGAAVGVLISLAVLTWPRRRSARATRSRNVLACGAGSGTPAEEARSDGVAATVARLWRADPVELVREWQLRRRPYDLLAGALDLLSGIGAGLERLKDNRVTGRLVARFGD